MLRALCLLALALCVSAHPADHDPESQSLHPILQWTGGAFSWPCPATKSIYKSSGRYINKNIIATRAQLYKDEVFLALPRYKAGVPATLAKTSLRKGCTATLTPFPCFSFQEEGTCSALQSVVDLVLDAQEVLWVLDVGITQTLDSPIRRCPPKVVAFNVKSGKVLKTLDLSGLACDASRLQYLAVDYSADGRCFVYVSDAATRAILVYDVQANRGFRVVLPRAVTAGGTRKDVLYLALVRKSCGFSYLYFSYLGASRMFSIRTDFLRRGSAQGRIQDAGPKPQKLVIIGTDNGSAIFFRNEGLPDVFRWDTNTKFEECNFLTVYKCTDCQLATHAIADYKR